MSLRVILARVMFLPAAGLGGGMAGEARATAILSHHRATHTTTALHPRPLSQPFHTGRPTHCIGGGQSAIR